LNLLDLVWIVGRKTASSLSVGEKLKQHVKHVGTLFGAIRREQCAAKHVRNMYKSAGVPSESAARDT